jgi:hypothetical protein
METVIAIGQEATDLAQICVLVRIAHQRRRHSSAAVLGYLVLADRKRPEDRREETRLHQAPANVLLSQVYAIETEISRLDGLPSLPSLAPDGFRFVATPSFGDTNFAISLRHTPHGGEGIWVMTPANRSNGPIRTIQLKLSPAAYNELTARLDALTAYWKGESNMWTDGTDIIFERVKDKTVTSDFGDSFRFYGEVGPLVCNALQTTTPQLGRFDSWHPRDR